MENKAHDRLYSYVINIILSNEIHNENIAYINRIHTQE